MKNGVRTAIYDSALRVEAYRFQGITQPFPNHFHQYYVIGVIEAGTRTLTCKGREYVIQKGTVLLFNPGDSHACIQHDSRALDYRGLNIAKDVMLELAGEITGQEELPGFSQNVILDPEAACCLGALHKLIMSRSQDFRKEEQLLFLLSRLIREYGQPFSLCVPECGAEIEKACAFMEQHFAQRIRLDQICRYVGLSKSTLLRAFVRAKGVTPYSYLENIRVSEAKKLLEQGVPPAETALRTGFSDQSHFTNYFSRFIGLTPGDCREIFQTGNLRSNEDCHN